MWSFFRNGVAVPALSVLLASPAAIYAQAPSGAQDANIQAEVQKSLDHKQFSDVHVAVHNGMVTLRGTVQRYADKEDADRKVHHHHDIVAVRNEIQVAGGETTDAALRDKLSKALIYDRVGYGTTAFNNITLNVQNAVVTIGGTVYGPADKDSALSLVANTAGVRDVIDNLEVAPVSPMDDRIRRDEFRAIYGEPALNRYAMDPAKTIRITVVNGHVALNGVVDSQGDKNIAGIRANGVPGVFSVQNNLQVAGKRE